MSDCFCCFFCSGGEDVVEEDCCVEHDRVDPGVGGTNIVVVCVSFSRFLM